MVRRAGDTGRCCLLGTLRLRDFSNLHPKQLIFIFWGTFQHLALDFVVYMTQMVYLRAYDFYGWVCYLPCVTLLRYVTFWSAIWSLFFL